MRQIPLPPPFHVFQGLLGLMDREDRPRGLFDLFGHENEAAPSTEDEANREAQARWVTDPVFQDARVEELRNLLTTSDPQEWDPETLAFLRTLKVAGDRASASALTATNFGPWAFTGLGGLTRIGPRPGPGATSAPQSGPGLVVGAPQTKPAESQAYSLPRLDDAEAEPLPGSSFLFGGPQAGTVENEESQVYHLPPAEDGSDEDSEESPEQKAIKERAAARAKEHWDAFCKRQWDLEKRRCADKFSYTRDAYGRCMRKAYNRYSACLTDKDIYERQSTDDQENGGWRPKTPAQKRRQKWQRPRSE